MYPFERFTEATKDALTLAQQEAERAHRSYIGTEHILLGLMAQSGTVASEVLRRLGIVADDVRARIEAVLSRNERIIIQQIIPTSRVKTVIEKSFEEARRSGVTYVGTDHLLIGILIEGQGIAAHVLNDMGVTLDRVVKEAHVASREGRISEETGPPDASTFPSDAAHDSDLSILLRLAHVESAADADDEVGGAHILRALLRHGDVRVLRALDQLGVDTERLSSLLQPPKRVIELREAVRAALVEKQLAAAREDYPAAEVAKRREVALTEELKAAEEQWNA